MIRGVLAPGSETIVTSQGSGASIGVDRRRLAGSKWRATMGVLRFDTSALGDRLDIESAVLVLYVLGTRSADRTGLVVHFCPGLWPIAEDDFRAFAPPGGTRVAIRRIPRGPVAVALGDPSAVSLDGPTELCLSLSGRVPRGQNVVTFASRELAEQRSAALVVTYRIR